MNIKISTPVKGNYQEIMARFDRDLFEALAPKSPKMEIVEFTGSRKGDRVHIRFVSPVRVDWISLITKDRVTDSEAYFVDEGVQLPPPLRYWKHKHIVQKVDEDTSLIIDDITYRGPNLLVSILMYPAIFFGLLSPKKDLQILFWRDINQNRTNEQDPYRGRGRQRTRRRN